MTEGRKQQRELPDYKMSVLQGPLGASHPVQGPGREGLCSGPPSGSELESKSPAPGEAGLCPPEPLSLYQASPGPQRQGFPPAGRRGGPGKKPLWAKCIACGGPAREPGAGSRRGWPQGQAFRGDKPQCRAPPAPHAHSPQPERGHRHLPWVMRSGSAGGQAPSPHPRHWF